MATANTDDDGKFTSTIISDKFADVGLYNVTAKFEDDGCYFGSRSLPVEITVNSETMLILDEIQTPSMLENPITVTGLLVDKNGKGIGNKQITLSVNGTPINAAIITNDTQGSEGVFTYTFEPATVGEYLFTAAFEADGYYCATETPTGRNVIVNSNTNLTLDEITEYTKVYVPVTISGKLTDIKGNGIAGTIKIFINDRYYCDMDSLEDGTFSDEIPFTEAGQYTIRAQYDGEEYYIANISNEIEVIVKSPTVIEYELVNDVEGKVVIDIRVYDAKTDDQVVNAKVDLSGDITATDVRTNKLYKNETLTAGDYAVTITFNGKDYYENSTTEMTFTVAEDPEKIIEELQQTIDELTGPQNTTLTIDPLPELKYKDKVTITGSLINSDSIGLFNQNITLTFGETEVNLTTKGGIFEYTTTFLKTGETNITATYDGTDKYKASNASITVNVEKMDLVITYKEIPDVKYKENVTITGKFTDAKGRAIRNTNVIIKINDKTYKAVSNSTGAYTLSIAAKTIGTNNVTLSYAGNANYNAYETNTTFNVEKQDMIITYETIEDTKYKDNVTISGKVTDANGEAIYNINVIITINGKTFKAKTDITGAFTFTTTATTVGTNNITLS